MCRFHKTKPVLLCYHWQTFHTEDVLSMARYQNQFLGTSSYNGDILFWNISMLKPIFNFNASRSPLPLLPKRVWSAGTHSSLSALGQNHVGLLGVIGVGVWGRLGCTLGSRQNDGD